MQLHFLTKKKYGLEMHQIGIVMALSVDFLIVIYKHTCLNELQNTQLSMIMQNNRFV